jgi:hypothetical protein
MSRAHRLFHGTHEAQGRRPLALEDCAEHASANRLDEELRTPRRLYASHVEMHAVEIVHGARQRSGVHVDAE